MSSSGVDGSDMSPTWLDDGTIEQIVAGDEVDARLEPLAVFARATRALEEEPVPAASPVLEAMFVAGAAPGRSRRRRARVLTEGLSTAAAKIAALGLAAKIGLGTAVAAAGVASAGATGVLPDQANDRVRGAIEAVTPVDFGDRGAAAERGGDGDGDDGSRFGDRVSSDATGESDGENGVDGQQISDEAPGAANRPADPGQGGRDQADQTPAADHVPDDPGNGQADPPSRRPGSPPSTTPLATSTVPSTWPAD